MTLYVISFVIIASSLLSAGKSDLSDILLLSAIIYFNIIERKIKKKFSVPSILMLFLILIFGSSIPSLVQSESILTSQQALRSWVTIVYFAAISSSILNKENSMKRFIGILVRFSAVLVTVSLLFNIINLNPPKPELSLVFPSFGHIRFAEFFLPFIPLSILLVVEKKNSIIIRFSAFISIVFMFFTLSRASMLSILVVPFLIIFFIDKNTFIKMIKPALFLAFTIILFLVSMIKVWRATEYIVPNWYHFFDIAFKPLYLDSRFSYYLFAVSKIINKPLFGHGLGTFYYSTQSYFYSASSTIMAHNHILQKLYEIGIVGTTVYLLSLIILFYRSIRSTRGNTHGRLLLLGVLISFIQAQMDFGWEIPVVYLINIIIIFAYQPRNKKLSSLASSINVIIFISLVFWTIGSGISNKSTSQKFNKLIGDSVRTNFQSSQLVNEWISLDRGNGRMYISLSGKEFIAGNYKSSLDYAFKSVNSSMYSDTVSQKYLLRYLSEPVVSNLDNISIYKLLDLLSKAGYPHDFFWINPEENRTVVYYAVDKLIASRDLSTTELAKINYWKFTQTFTTAKYELRLYYKYLDRAIKLDPENEEYLKIGNLSRDILDGKSSENIMKEILDLLKIYPKRDIYIGLGDLIYSNMVKELEKSGSLSKELETRQKRINFSHYGTAYVSYAARLNSLRKNQESEDQISECVKLYPDCDKWYKDTAL